MRISQFFMIYLLISGILYSSTLSYTTNTVIKNRILNDSIPEPFFNITLLTRDIPSPQVKIMKLIGNEMRNIGIGVELDISSSTLIPRVYNNASSYEEGSYDITGVGFADCPFVWDPGPIDTFFSEPFEGYDELKDSYRSELDEAKRSSILKEIQALFYDYSNIIVLYRESELWVFNDSWDLSQEDLLAISTTTMRSGWADFGFNNIDPLIIGRPVVLTQDHLGLHSEDPYFFWDIIYDSRYPSLIWQGLYERNRTNNFNWTPLLAKSMPKWSNNNKTATIELRDDVFFADGHPLTSHDVVETYRIHLTPAYDSLSYLFLIEHFASNESISALDDLSVQFNLTKPSPFVSCAFHLGIFPVHIWGNHTHPTVADYKFDVELLEDITETGKSDYCIGTGPYTYTNISVDSVKLEAVNPYWQGNVKTQEIHFKNYNAGFHSTLSKEDEDQAITDLQTGKTHLLEKYILQNLTKVQETEDINYHNLVTQGSRTIQINMKHPILGTGENTPLKTPEAAKYIRQAINHVIPRQKIIDELHLGCGLLGATVVNPLVRGFDESLEPYEYNITRAKELMEQAGYEYPLESSTTTTTTTTTTTESNTPTPGFEVIIVLAGMSSISSLVSIIRRRQH